MISYSTIQAMIDGGYTITIYCPADHGHVLDLQKLGAWLGFDHSTLHQDLIDTLWCPVCGSTDLSMRVSPPSPDPYPTRPR